MTTPLDLQQFEGHTPGPWTFDSRGRGFIRGADHGAWDSTVAIMCEYAAKDVRQQRQTANARLIVAAPALLARCKAMEAALHESEKFIRDYLRDSGGCDHSVGICECETKRLLDSVCAALAAKEPA